ncbi:hypothetical protein, partial [Desulfocucumis palustris]|uniref:hypothetical protein n=1 Tax=Desulfocucumis palustris TaxID=1898651 RepID=UPI001A9A50FC
KDLLHKDLKNFRKLYVGVRIRDACIAGRPRGERAVGYAVSHWARFIVATDGLEVGKFSPLLKEFVWT